MKLTKISAAVATGALFLSMAVPSFAATNNIMNNGAFSSNVVSWMSSHVLSASQSNTAVVSNTVKSNAKTGNNSSSFNVGGTGSVTSGPAHNTTTVNTLAGSNMMDVTGVCGCLTDAGTNTISGNGAFSTNTIAGTNTSTTSVSQTNTAVVTNNVTSNANSGGNSSSFNVGGTGGVTSGGASNDTTVMNTLNGNTMTVTP